MRPYKAAAPDGENKALYGSSSRHSRVRGEAWEGLWKKQKMWHQSISLKFRVWAIAREKIQKIVPQPMLPKF